MCCLFFEDALASVISFLLKETISPLPGFLPQFLHGTENEADGLPMGHHVSLYCSTLMNLESVRLTSLVGCPFESWKILKWCSWCAHRGSNLDRQITLNQLSQPPVETLFLGSARSPLEWLCQKNIFMSTSLVQNEDIFLMLVLLVDYIFLTTFYGLYFNHQLHITITISSSSYMFMVNFCEQLSC